MYTRTIRRVAVVAAASCVSLGVLAGSAFAANVIPEIPEIPDLEAILAEPAAVAPGGVGEISYTVRNVSEEATEGILINASLPKYVSMPLDDNCQETGTNDEGGVLISCNFSDAQGMLAPGESVEILTPFSVADDAPAGTELGTLDALVVPVTGGEPLEDYTDLEGENVVETIITTAESGAWSSFLGLFS